MTKMQGEHRNSLVRAITILEIHLNRQNVPKYRNEFVRDIKRLKQVLDFINNDISYPMFDKLEDTACELAI